MAVVRTRSVPLTFIYHYALIFCTHSCSVSCLVLCVFGEGSGICHLAEERTDRGRAWWGLCSIAPHSQLCRSTTVHEVGECCEEIRHTGNEALCSHTAQTVSLCWGKSLVSVGITHQIESRAGRPTGNGRLQGEGEQ